MQLTGPAVTSRAKHGPRQPRLQVKLSVRPWAIMLVVGVEVMCGVAVI